jgi:hypothetical protein
MVTAAPLLEELSHPVFGPQSRSEKNSTGPVGPTTGGGGAEFTVTVVSAVFEPEELATVRV